MLLGGFLEIPFSVKSILMCQNFAVNDSSALNCLDFRFPAVERPFILRVPQAPGTKVWFSFRKQRFALKKYASMQR